MESFDEELWKGWFRRVSQGEDCVTRDALVQAAEESADVDSRPVVRDVILNLWQGGGSLSLESFLATGIGQTLASMGLVSPRQSPRRQNGVGGAPEPGTGGPEEDDSLLLQLRGMGFTEDQAQRGATCGSLQAALESLLDSDSTNGGATPPPTGEHSPQHCDPFAPIEDQAAEGAANTDTAAIGANGPETERDTHQHLTETFGFTQEEADQCLEDIPKLRRHNNPIAWCMDWKEGCLPSLQCRSATADTCAICFADRGSYLMTCENKCIICQGCMFECLKGRITEHKTTPEDMQCPSGDGGEVPPDCVQAVLVDQDRVLYDKYLSLAARKEAEKWGGESVFCPACDWFCIVSTEEQKWKVRCGRESCPLRKQECRGFFCGLCGERPHRTNGAEDMTCEQYARHKAAQDKDAAEFRRFMKENKFQVCPKCGEPSVLEAGCKYVKCRCGTHYCHHCGRALPNEKQHYSHWYDGPYGQKCYGGALDKDGYRAVGGTCEDCLGWSYGRTSCTKCRYWQTDGKPPDGEEEDAYQEPEQLLAPGDKVRVKGWVKEPKHKWGAAKAGEIGKVCRVDGLSCVVEFSKAKEWRGYTPEMEVVDPGTGRPRAGQHSGMWRQAPKKYYCSKEKQEEGPLCVHGSEICQRDHWSCCGSQELVSTCRSGSERGPAAAAAVAVADGGVDVRKARAMAQAGPVQFMPGDVVRVRPDVKNPKYKWGAVKRSDLGSVKEVNQSKAQLRVAFPDRCAAPWLGHAPEMLLVSRFQVGERVRVRSEVDPPRYQWGPVQPGDIGKVAKLRADDAKMNVDFQSKNGWVAAIHEMIHADRVEEPIAEGCAVRVRSTVKEPKYKWGSVQRGQVGVVIGYGAKEKCFVYFTQKTPKWNAHAPDMEVVWRVGDRVRLKKES
eukprot:Hpha_TRINITY_DN14460_c1_g2::TRINITY_DN14460_c1_g2_i1::g.158008::m.158008